MAGIRDEGMRHRYRFALAVVGWEARDFVTRVGSSVGCVVAGSVAWYGWSGQVNQPPALITATVAIVVFVGILGLVSEVVYPLLRRWAAPRALLIAGTRLLDEVRHLLPMTQEYWTDWAVRCERWRLEAHFLVQERRPDLARLTARAISEPEIPMGRYGGTLGGDARQRVHLVAEVLRGVIEHKSEADVTETFELRVREKSERELYRAALQEILSQGPPSLHTPQSPPQ